MAANNSSIPPTFSVVIPLYQKRHRIEACLASVRAQTIPPLEVIIVDDGSTDGGGELAKAVGAGWIRYIHQWNQGVSAARNHGIALAKGDYVAFLDADDAWRSSHLAVLTGLAISHPDAPILGTGWTEHGRPFVDPYLTADEVVVDLSFFLARGAKNMHCYATPAVAVRTDVASSVELFPVASRIAEDQDAWLTLLGFGCGVRSMQVTVDVVWDPVNPTMTNPRPEDFESVIFDKWSRVSGGSGLFSRFVELHRLFTIQRHVGFASNSFLLGKMFETGSFAFPIRRIGILFRMLLQAVGLLGVVRALKHM